MSALVLIFVLLILIALRVPIAISLGLSSIIILLSFTNQQINSLATGFYHTMEIVPLLALPFFVLAANFMTTGGVAHRLINLANALVGRFRGGLAMAALLACALFSAVSGSAPATVIAVGSVMITGMVSSGYRKDFAAGVICNAGTLGILIPPSLVMVIYGAVSETSIGNLFMAGIVPGILLTIVLMIVIAVIAYIQDLPRYKVVPFKETLRLCFEAFPGLFTLVIILGGIYSGLFSPTEAAAVAAVYAFLISTFYYRDLKMSQVKGVLLESAKITAMLMFIIANAYLFKFVLTTEQIPQQAAEWIVGLGLPAWGFLIAMNILLLIWGNFMEPTSVVLVITPLVLPIATELGIDPIHLGIIMVLNMQIGLVSPPVGLNLFVTSSVAQMSLEQVIKASLPWLIVLLFVLGFITYIPWFSLALPRALGVL
jgi:C4-dicarboxylate transporter DctM subunit